MTPQLPDKTHYLPDTTSSYLTRPAKPTVHVTSASIFNAIIWDNSTANSSNDKDSNSNHDNSYINKHNGSSSNNNSDSLSRKHKHSG